jgi:diguanylate cyclase (GGDEF)-like protein/PAS domain S-box-containing protein
MDGRFIRVNRALCELLGRRSDELVGSTTTPFTHPDDLQVTADAYAHLRDAGSILAVEKRYLRPDGEVVWALTHGQTVQGVDGKGVYIVSHFLDVTAMKLVEQRQQEASALFETAFADAPIGMALFARTGRWIKVNRALCRLTGYTEAQLLALTSLEITHPDDVDAVLEHRHALIAGDEDQYSSEQRYIGAEGQEIWVNVVVSIVRDQAGQPLHFIAHVEPISERRELQARLRALADHDPLTGLWNRRRFDEELDHETARYERYPEPSALLIIDLDEFKSVNDTHGHLAGDELLRLIATRIRAALRASDSVARIGGDEFAAILPNIAPGALDHVIAKLRRAILASQITVNGETFGVSASIGSQALDGDAPDRQAAMAKADAAMYQSKPYASA